MDKKIENNLNFKNIFLAEPPINSGYHFGSRLVIKDKHLYVSFKEQYCEVYLY